MADIPLDRLHIRGLVVRCIVGIYPEERREKQEVSIDVTLHADLRVACASDNIDDTVNYKTIKKEILALVENSSFFLIEHLAERIAEIAMKPDEILRVDVTVDKPGALRFARSVAVEITRTKS